MAANSPVTFETVRKYALNLPEVEESTSYGTAAFRVRGKVFARMHQMEDAVVVKADFDHRDQLMQANPKTFYITDHYLKYEWVLVRLSPVRPDELEEILEQGWRLAAPKRLVESHGADS